MAARPRGRRLLLTGRPGVGKTTVLRRLTEYLSDWRLAGFYTQEIRKDGRRLGFRAVSFDDREWVIAHVAFSGTHRVGKYGVDVAAIDELADVTLTEDAEIELFLVDEIGKMECLSENFVRGTRRLLDSVTSIVATVAEHGSGFIAEIKRRQDFVLRSVTVENRDVLPGEIALWLEESRE